MVSKTNEQALESAIEKALTGISSEELKQGLSAADLGLGYIVGSPSDFDKQYALDSKLLLQFLENNQEDELEKIKIYNPNDWQRKIYERFDRLAKKHGVLHLLKKGLDVDNAHFNLMYPEPLVSSSEKVKLNFESNIFSCTRQLCYSEANPLQEIDMVLFINGIPIITLELKNAWTGQTARYNGQKQYRNDRDINQTLLNFGRCLVHMTLDTDEAYMTTKLAGKATFFLPFNKGYNYGQGNPPNPNGHKTSYIWQEVFTKSSIANIIQHFMRLDGTQTQPLSKRTLFSLDIIN